MNKIKSIFLMLLLSSSSISFAQTTEELKVSALRDAKITATATLKMDFETILKYTYPSIVELMGGKEKGLELLKTTFDNMKAQNFVFEKADVLGVSDIVFEQDEYRCYIEGLNQMTISGMRVKSKSYLLGIYNNEDKFWYFLEAKQLKNKVVLDKVLPNFETSLVIPDDSMETEKIED